LHVTYQSAVYTRCSFVPDDEAGMIIGSRE